MKSERRSKSSLDLIFKVKSKPKKLNQLQNILRQKKELFPHPTSSSTRAILLKQNLSHSLSQMVEFWSPIEAWNPALSVRQRNDYR